LPFSLIADPDKQILQAYGAWGEKNMYGKKVMGVLRTTFIIDESGNILKIIKKVNTGDHTKQILQELEIN
jgi:peroxiredoxin Q/BCP